MAQPLTQREIDFIIQNKGKMLQKKIAAELNITPACVCKVLKKHHSLDGYFDIDNFAKYYSF